MYLIPWALWLLLIATRISSFSGNSSAGSLRAPQLTADPQHGYLREHLIGRHPSSSILEITTGFGYTGGVQGITIATGIVSIDIQLYGAGGNTYNYNYNGGFYTVVGGNGGLATATFAVSAGSVFYIYVGGQPTGSLGTYGGFNGGGNGGSVYGSGGNGGTDIRNSAGGKFMAAGGGGGAYPGCNGGTGGSTGTAGGCGSGGGGASQTGGGYRGCSSTTCGYAGAAGQGGYGEATYGAGGGGGWYGGGGAYASGGGGGSSYVPSYATSAAYTNGYWTGNGYATIIQNYAPTFMPTLTPTLSPSNRPTIIPTLTPTIVPTVTPTTVPSVVPSIFPSVVPTLIPSTVPTLSPTLLPSVVPSIDPTVQPSLLPTVCPSIIPSAVPSIIPTAMPSVVPSTVPTIVPTITPTRLPSVEPSVAPSTLPSATPTIQPSHLPSVLPTVVPSITPTIVPTANPTLIPTRFPTVAPTIEPSVMPTTTNPTIAPSAQPTVPPTTVPSDAPTVVPTQAPTLLPGQTHAPTTQPTTHLPTVSPTFIPTVVPTMLPSATPSIPPSLVPTVVPTTLPTAAPTICPTAAPSMLPTLDPSALPTVQPSDVPTFAPSVMPTDQPTLLPTLAPSIPPSVLPTVVPTISPTISPTGTPSEIPTPAPTCSPSTRPTEAPSACPSTAPSMSPTAGPTQAPTLSPSQLPSLRSTTGPTLSPTQDPSELPSAEPSVQPSVAPSMVPTEPPKPRPSITPSTIPTVEPSALPTQLSNAPSMIPTRTEEAETFDSTVSVIGANDQTFRIVIPFLTLAYGATETSAFSDIVLNGTSATGTSYVITEVSSKTDVSGGVGYSGAAVADNSKRSAAVSDVNSDSHSDLIIGDPYGDQVYVLLGSATQQLVGMDTGFVVIGEDSGDMTGWSVSGAGDVNNDTVTDLVIGAPLARGGLGAFYVIYGRRTKNFNIFLTTLTAERGFAVYGDQPSGYLGISVSDAGDTDNDGFDDVIIGAVLTSNYASGAAYVAYGSRSGVSSISACWRLMGSRYSYAGYSVSSAGDVNGDGRSDVVVGSAPKLAGSAIAAYVVFGAVSTRGSTLQLSGLSLDQGSTIVGAGTVVSSSHPGEGLVLGSLPVVTQTGLVLFTNVTHLTRLTAVPSLAPTALPFVAPSPSPTVSPKCRPTISPTTRSPTMEPSRRPTAPSVSPSLRVTNLLSESPSELPTREPSETPTLRPSVEPTDLPTLAPTLLQTAIPLSLPSLSPSASPTLPPSPSPTTSMPTLPLTTRSPIPRPTLAPTQYNRTSQYEEVWLNGGTTAVNGSRPAVNYVINTSQHVTVRNVWGNIRYTLTPNTGELLTVVSFNASTDVIDLSAFRYLHDFSQLTLTEGSVLVGLPRGQTIHILNLHVSDVGRDNFVLYQPDAAGQEQGSEARRGLSVAVGVVIGLVALVCLVLVPAQAVHSWRERMAGKVKEGKFFLFIIEEADALDVEDGESDGVSELLSDHTLDSEGNFLAKEQRALDDDQSSVDDDGVVANTGPAELKGLQGQYLAVHWCPEFHECIENSMAYHGDPASQGNMYYYHQWDFNAVVVPNGAYQP